MKDKCAVILAAGKGTRMKSSLPKVLHRICGAPLLVHLIRQVKKGGYKKIVVVAGYKSGLIADAVKGEGVEICIQKEQKGTADALVSAKKNLKGFDGDILVLPGDVFIENTATLKKFFAFHKKTGADMSVLVDVLDNPKGYGRIIRDGFGGIKSIREELDANHHEKMIREINTGIYVFDAKSLFFGLGRIGENKRKKEYYLTDIVEIFVKNRKNVEGFVIPDGSKVIGVNDRLHLSEIHAVFKSAIIKSHQLKGVTVLEPSSTYIECNVKIGEDTVIYPYTYIESDVVIGKECQVGPFCKIRSGSKIGDKSQIGSFVEVVRSKVGKKTNIKHLSYIGDAVVGNGVNVGAGTITANYDGKNKSKTVIGDGAFIGSDTVLVAPVKIGKGGKTGAGSIVLKGRNVKSNEVVCGVPAKKIDK